LIERPSQGNSPKKENKQITQSDTQEKQKPPMITDIVHRLDQLRTLAREANVLKFGQELLGVEPKGWANNPWLLETKQGMIDLRTGLLRAGRPQDRTSTPIPTEWKSLNEPAPRFMQFLHEIFADREGAERVELIAFLQRALGYGITGHADESVFLLFYSKQEYSGKSTLIHILEKVLDKAVYAIPGDALLTDGHGGSYLGNLQGKRIVWASEPDHGGNLASEEVKQLTSGRWIVARQLYGLESTFIPTHLLILLTNRKPEVNPAERAFWERACPIAFNMRFVDRPERPGEMQRDPRLLQTLEAESSGILAWLVRGALEWRRLGLAIPESVRKERHQEHDQESSIKHFIQICCELDPQAQTPAGGLYKRYKVWATKNNLIPVGHKQFSQEIQQIEQIKAQQSKRGMVYRGIRFAKERSKSSAHPSLS
jgi:putative DNA primase/helicase